MIAVNLDRGIIRAARSAEEQDLVSLSEDEEVGDQVLEPLRVERRAENREEQATEWDSHVNPTYPLGGVGDISVSPPTLLDAAGTPPYRCVHTFKKS